MANIAVTGIDDMIKALRSAEILDDETEKEMLFEAGNIIVEELQKTVRSSGFRTEAYAGSVKYAKKIKTDKYGEPYISITAKGKNTHGRRRAEVLFVLNYGRSPEYGEITGTYFWTRGTKNAEAKVTKVITQKLEEKLKERGLI